MLTTGFDIYLSDWIYKSILSDLPTIQDIKDKLNTFNIQHHYCTRNLWDYSNTQ